MASNNLEEAVAVANLFLDHGTIVSVEGQRYPKKTFVAENSKAVSQLPLAVLIDRGSASDAEVIASAILENNRGDVVGEKSYGIGSVQKLIPLEDGAAIILSVGKFFTPSGHLIQNDKDLSKSGVTPNVVVKTDDDSLLALNTPPDESEASTTEKGQAKAGLPPKPRNQPDLILNKALEVLREEPVKDKKAA